MNLRISNKNKHREYTKKVVTSFFFCPKKPNKKIQKMSKKVLTNKINYCIMQSVPRRGQKVH